MNATPFLLGKQQLPQESNTSFQEKYAIFALVKTKLTRAAYAPNTSKHLLYI